jgi:peptide/nickel transport system substrate-binding protein
MTGCSQQTKEETQKTPAKQKTLIVGEMWDIKGLDSTQNGELVKEKMMITETLVQANPDFSLKPGLAKSWERVNDTQWKFHLREGVKFHDGKELTADAVKWSVERALKVDPTLKELTKINTIEVADKNTVVFNTDVPYAAFPASLEYPGLAIASPSSEINEKGAMTKPIGTGSFKLEKWDTATGTVDLVRNDSYWGTKPKLEKITIKAIPDPSSRSMAVEKGEVDFTCDVPYGDIDRLKKTSGVKVDIQPTARVYRLSFGKLNGTPYSDVRVRKAINYAIDRNVIAEKTLHGAAAPAVGPFLPSIKWANKNLKGDSYDPQKAKALLAEAGWKDVDGDGILEKNGEKFSITLYTYPQRPGLPPMAEAIQSMLKDIGIKAEVRVMDSNAIKGQIKDKDMQLAAYATAMVPDPDFYLRRTYYSKGTYNTWGYSNSEMDSLLEQGLKTFDEGKRQEIYNKVQEMAVDDVPVIHVAYYKAAVVMRDYVKNFVFNPVAHDYMLNPEMDVEK